jgi:hypothetical protein
MLALIPKTNEKLLKIEKYNLEEVVFDLYWKVSKDQSEIADICNHRLEKRKEVLAKHDQVASTFQYATITSYDVKAFLEKFAATIQKNLSRKQRKMMERSLDVIEELQSLAASCKETLDVWQARLKDEHTKDDLASMVRAGTMLQRERQQLSDIVQSLAQLTGKVKTYITIDALQQHVITMIQVIENDEDISQEKKIQIMDKLNQAVQIRVHQQVEDND